MKRRILLLAGATAMSLTSVLGVSIANPAPASANGFATIGYIIQCLSPQHLFHDFAFCLREALEDLLSTIGLPAFPGFPTSAAAPTSGGKITLPTNIANSIKTLPPALQTNPVAAAPSVNAPVRELIPSLSNLNLGSRSASVPGAGVTKPVASPISLFNIAETSKPASSNPVSGNDLAGVVGLGLVGTAIFGAMRRRAAVR
ncbi:MAG TPA: hypothetical protein VMZ22_09345 [Acidimicrobiales bacterium]|nr:hypothetical protein [Acidimicrobiales bacterium]